MGGTRYRGGKKAKQKIQNLFEMKSKQPLVYGVESKQAEGRTLQQPS